jgi:putative ABC transport system substrate-binding protein
MAHWRRRQFIILLGGAAGWPLKARAQERVRRIGVLMPLDQADQEARSLVAAFVKGLDQRGWTVGGYVRVDFRWAAGDVQRIQTFARELVEKSRT